MLTGYNTDVSYGGVLFHVQTEDKGIHSPLILSLVYRAGTILAAKRTPYSNLIQNGIVDEEALAQILTRQHQILVAAIQAGKSDKLVALSRSQGEKKAKEPVAVSSKKVESDVDEPTSIMAAPCLIQGEEKKASLPSSDRAASAPPLRAMSAPQNVGAALSFDQIITGYLQNDSQVEQPRIELLYPSKFRAGDEVTVRAAVFMGGHQPEPGAHVQLQVLGTKIKPQTWKACSDTLGLVSFSVTIPVFTTGAAALIITATARNGQDVEAKYIISVK